MSDPVSTPPDREENIKVAKQPKTSSSLVDDYFCPNTNPFETVEWGTKHVHIKDADGKTLYENSVEYPISWSDQSVQIVASKYFYGGLNDDVRENSVRQLVHRVARTIADWGLEGGYFKDAGEADSFYRELAWLCLHQHGAFNSPVWFSLGLGNHLGIRAKNNKHLFFHWNENTKRAIQTKDIMKAPQLAACFIVPLDDSMEGIMQLSTTEAMLYKWGSGIGVNYSTLRSKHEELSGGGRPSGPLSFMRISDAIGGTVKSGGKLRRAAAMKILNADHPDIIDFIEAKAIEEEKARALIREGYSGGMDGDAYSTVQFQNSNFSVRVTDAFMKACEEDADWHTKTVRGDKIVDTLKAREILQKMAESCHMCGDPGIQFHDQFNKWNTCPKSGEIVSTNPCAEFAFIEMNGGGLACNLASLNLMRFVNQDGAFDIERFQKAIDIFIVAQDIICDRASYPTKKIAENVHRLRPIGLGYSNLGALLMSSGLPYDSDLGREFASAITSLLTAHAYHMSSRIAAKMGAFEKYKLNRIPMRKIISQHREHNSKHLVKKDKTGFNTIFKVADELWESNEKAKGFRNAQMTVLAPAGTISFMMGCDTTGVEPDYSLIKYKQLASGGTMKIFNHGVSGALKNLGYPDHEVVSITDYLTKNGKIEGAPFLKSEHLSVFACASGESAISYWGHIKMLAAIQPFISGGISKTVNCPEETTIEEIQNIYVEAWKMGLKCVAIFREGSKNAPLSGKGKNGVELRPVPKRYKLHDTCDSIRHKFEINGHEGYFIIGKYPDGSPGELFVKMSKQGSAISGLFDAYSLAISLLLQNGIPLESLVEKFSYMRFEPSGWTPNKDIRQARSPVDYIFRWMSNEFLNKKVEKDDGAINDEFADVGEIVTQPNGEPSEIGEDVVCKKCGHYPMTKTGTCHTCSICGTTGGCG